MSDAGVWWFGPRGKRAGSQRDGGGREEPRRKGARQPDADSLVGRATTKARPTVKPMLGVGSGGQEAELSRRRRTGRCTGAVQMQRDGIGVEDDLDDLEASTARTGHVVRLEPNPDQE